MGPKEGLTPSRINLGKHRRHRPTERRDLATGIKANLAEEVLYQDRRAESIDGFVCGLVWRKGIFARRRLRLAKGCLFHRGGTRHLACMARSI
jgi:hypothetical protein